MTKVITSSANQALQLLASVEITGPPVDPWLVIERLSASGYPIGLVEDSFDGFEGCTMRKDGRSVIVLNKSFTYLPRKRFTLSHEIGHVHLPTHDGRFQCAGDIENPHAKRLESEANDFASELLLPTDWLVNDIGYASPSLELIRQLSADRYGTSLTATALKVVALASEPCILILSENNRVKWAQKSGKWSGYIPSDWRLHPGTCAARHYDGKKLPSKPTEVLYKAWMPDAEVDDDTWLFEDTVELLAPGQVLTILTRQDDNW